MPPVTKSHKIAVLCGGPSSEAEVSRRSGRNCYEALLRLGYEKTMLIELDSRVAQTLVEEDIDVVFMALHGKYGEDGCIQGLLEILQIPYTGSRLKAMALSWDKHVTKCLLAQAGLPVLPSVVTRLELSAAQAAIESAGLTYPLISKPPSEGSSVGMQKIETPADLEAALEAAKPYCDEVLIEPFVTGKDLTVGVLHRADGLVAMPILELRSKSASGWYDYEAKYTPGMTEFILPAELSEADTRQVQDLAIAAHKALGCHGVSRTDFVFDTQRNAPFILEVNTIPGMTAVSDLPAQAQVFGLSYDELVDCILQTACLEAALSSSSSKSPVHQ
jgi:D-alanine-D-alanine ligase